MLSKIRKNMRAFSIPLWIVAASFVGTIFLVWGRGSVGGPSANEVATVNGKPIDLVEFNKEYNRIINEIRAQFGDNYGKLFKDKEIKIATLQRLIIRELLLQEAERLGIKVSDWAVAERIKSIPSFQKNGKFSEELYYEYLKANRLTPKVFEEEVRKDLLVEKLLTVIENSPSITEFELQNLYRKTFGKREFKYKIFKFSDFKVNVSRKEVEDFYNKNKDQFKERVGEKYMVVKISKEKKDAKELAKKIYSLAKEGSIKELSKLNPIELKDKELLEKFKNKTYGFWSDNKFYYVLFKDKGKTIVKPLKEVYKEIELIIKEQKASLLARKEAEKWLKEKKKLPLKTPPLNKDDFFKNFKPLDLGSIENLFDAPKGKRILLALTDGFGVFEPVSDLEVDKVEKEKMDELRKLIYNVKVESNYQNLVNLLRQKATIKINEKLFK
ncbi:MAG: SurA N-terminal domain-containing protein [Desulfurobacteriaceae bacterium]